MIAGEDEPALAEVVLAPDEPRAVRREQQRSERGPQEAREAPLGRVGPVAGDASGGALTPRAPERCRRRAPRPHRASGRWCRVRWRPRRASSGEISRVESAASRRRIASWTPAESASMPLSACCAAPATGALLGTRGQEDLHGGVGEHHRADVASLDHDVVVGAERTLLGDHRLAHDAEAGDGAHGVVDGGRADLGGHVGTGDADARRERVAGLVDELDGRVGDDAGDRGAVVGIDTRSTARERPRRGTSHRCRGTGSPDAAATLLATVDLPEPAGPSMAMIIGSEFTSARGIRRTNGTTRAPTHSAVRERPLALQAETLQIANERRIADVDGFESVRPSPASPRSDPPPPTSSRAGGRRANRASRRAAAPARAPRACRPRPRRALRARSSPSTIAASRSDSLTRSSPTPSKRVSPCACEATSARIGTSSMSDGTSSAVTIVDCRARRVLGVDLAGALALRLGKRDDLHRGAHALEHDAGSRPASG